MESIASLEDVLADVGTKPSAGNEVETECIVKTSQYFCHICFDIHEHGEGYRLVCGHMFCRDCLERYLEVTISDGDIHPKCFHPTKKDEVPPHNNFDLEPDKESLSHKLLSSATKSVDENEKYLETEALPALTETQVEADCMGLQPGEVIVGGPFSSSSFYTSSNSEGKSTVDDESGPKAPMKTCQTEISENEVRTILCQNTEALKKYDYFKFTKSNSDARECPHCHSLQIGNPSAPQMTCAECNLVFCFFHSNAHPGKTCEEYEQQIAPDTAKTRSLLESTSKPCPGCKLYIEKSGGCNHMKCTNCGTAFCWLCGQAIDDAVFPVHFQWWNPSGCANLQMNDALEPSTATRWCARLTTLAEFIFLGPIVLISTIASLLLCCCCIPQMLPPKEDSEARSRTESLGQTYVPRSFCGRFWELFANCLSGWSMLYIAFLFILPLGLAIVCTAAGIVAAVCIIIYPCYASLRLYRREYPWPDEVGEFAASCWGCLRRTSCGCLRLLQCGRCWNILKRCCPCLAHCRSPCTGLFAALTGRGASSTSSAPGDGGGLPTTPSTQGKEDATAPRVSFQGERVIKVRHAVVTDREDDDIEMGTKVEEREEGGEGGSEASHVKKKCRPLSDDFIGGQEEELCGNGLEEREDEREVGGTFREDTVEHDIESGCQTNARKAPQVKFAVSDKHYMNKDDSEQSLRRTRELFQHIQERLDEQRQLLLLQQQDRQRTYQAKNGEEELSGVEGTQFNSGDYTDDNADGTAVGDSLLKGSSTPRYQAGSIALHVSAAGNDTKSTGSSLPPASPQSHHLQPSAAASPAPRPLSFSRFFRFQSHSQSSEGIGPPLPLNSAAVQSMSTVNSVSGDSVTRATSGDGRDREHGGETSHTLPTYLPRPLEDFMNDVTRVVDMWQRVVLDDPERDPILRFRAQQQQQQEHRGNSQGAFPAPPLVRSVSAPERPTLKASSSSLSPAVTTRDIGSTASVSGVHRRSAPDDGPVLGLSLSSGRSTLRPSGNVVAFEEAPSSSTPPPSLAFRSLSEGSAPIHSLTELPLPASPQEPPSCDPASSVLDSSLLAHADGSPKEHEDLVEDRAPEDATT